MVSLHSQLLIICTIVANVEAKASSSNFFASTISLTCAHVFYNSMSSNKLFKLTDLLSNKSPSSNPTHRETTVTPCGNLGSVLTHCDSYS